MTPMMLSSETIRERLRAHLGRHFGRPADVHGIRPLAGGASRAAYAIDIVLGNETTGSEGHVKTPEPDMLDTARPSAAANAPLERTLRAVLRLDLGGEIYTSALTRVEEAKALVAAYDAGIPVPRIHCACDDAEVLGNDFLVMERVDGETVGRRIVKSPELSAARDVLPAQMGDALAAVHALPPAALPFLGDPGPSPARAVLEEARSELDRVAGSHPVLEACWHWLWQHAPADVGRVVLHGDFRLGNVIVGERGLRSVIDWEFCSLGDPHADLAWPFVRDWRFGNDSQRFAGLSDGKDFIAAYEQSSGRQIEPQALLYWEILGNYRWALGCLTQAQRHLSGEYRSVELASLGRRAAEMELECMELIDRFQTPPR